LKDRLTLRAGTLRAHVARGDVRVEKIGRRLFVHLAEVERLTKLGLRVSAFPLAPPVPIQEGWGDSWREE
jgi:hypothetical protein